ncbi:MAG: DUF2190 family protein [Proteobacteria bacterium]|nr:DUF2190 family protein [Pseudomonadota bacterium]
MRDLGDGTTDIASDDTSTAMIGVLQNKPKATGRAASIAYLGPSKVVAGGTVTRGALLTCNGSGRAADAGSGDMVFGRALAAAGADGEVVPALVFPPFKL